MSGLKCNKHYEGCNCREPIGILLEGHNVFTHDACQAEIERLQSRIAKLEEALGKMYIWCTCPEGRAQHPPETHVDECSFKIKHEALKRLDQGE